MGMNETPSANRVQIGVFGRTNAGKSSIVNAIAGQDVAVVSNVRGTTTDPVKKAMELLPLGPVVFIDTPGLDDEGEIAQVDALHDEVLAERAVVDVGAARLEVGDLLVGEQAHLAVPRARMGVVADAPVRAQLDALSLALLDSLGLARADGPDGAHGALLRMRRYVARHLDVPGATDMSPPARCTTGDEGGSRREVIVSQ